MVSLRQCVASSFIALSALHRGAQAAVADLYLINGYHSDCREGYQKVNTADGLNGDLNQGASGSDYIYLCVQYGSESDRAITDIAVVSQEEGPACGDLGGDWMRVGQEEGSNGDLDQGLVIEKYFYHLYIHLCYKASPGSPPIADLTLHTGDCPVGWTRILQDKDSNGDFNQGNYGTYIRMCQKRECIAEKVTGQWIVHGTISAPTTETWRHGTVKTVSVTKTEEWSQSVTSTVSAGFELKGVSGSAEISSTFSHTFSESDSEEWSVSEEHQFSLTWGQEVVGKTTWQFVFNPSDSCGNTVRSKLQEFAVTAGAWRPPCCLPGFGNAPSYDTCVSDEVMIPGGRESGCKVSPQRNISIVV